MKRITSFLLAIVLFAGFMLVGTPAAYATSNMVSSDMLVETIKAYEGFCAVPCWDYGQYTVGYGTRCPDDMLETYMARGITEAEAEVLLRNHLAAVENAVTRKFIKELGLTLNQGQFDALVSFTYNLGSAWMYDSTGTLFNAIVNGTTGSELIRAFSLWCSAGGSILPGLVRRRLAEANMYLNGEYATDAPAGYGYVYYNANGGSVEYRIQGYDANEGVGPAYIPTYSGHTFSGWYTSQVGGEKVTVLTKAYSGDTLYARWDAGEEEDVTKPETTPIDSVTVMVTAYDVNLRKGPGTNYSIVGSTGYGEKMVITETATGGGYTWGKAGDKWIALKFTNYDQVIKEQENPSDPTEPETTIPETTVPDTTVPEVKELTGTVKANGGLAVRTGPGTGYDYIRYLDNGTKVTITEQKTVGSMTWGKTSEGWISMSYVILDQEEPSEPTEPETTVPDTTVPETTVPDTTVPETTVPETTVPEDATVTGTVKADGGLNIRSGPGTNYGYAGFLEDGQKVTITERKTVNGMTWGKISWGWICMDYVVLDGEETPTEPTVPEETEPDTTVPEVTVPEVTEPEENEPEQVKLTGKVKADGGLAVRRGAGTSYAVKEYLFDGTFVTITEVEEVSGSKWGYIGSGWVCMDYIVLDGEEESDTKMIIADCLNVRQEPSLYAGIVGYYYYGAIVEIQETQDADGITWGKTSKGWISMDYVE